MSRTAFAAILGCGASRLSVEGFTAYQVLERLEQSDQEIPLILITGNLGEEAAVDCIKAGMTDYVLKDRLFRLPMVIERSLREFELKRQQQAAMAQIRQQAQREAIINRIVQAMRETLVLDEVLQTTANMLHDALQVDRCLIMRSSLDIGEMVVCNVSEASPNRESLVGLQCPVFDYFHDELYRGELVAVTSLEQITQLDTRTAAAEFGNHSMLLLPLVDQQDFLVAFVYISAIANARGQRMKLRSSEPLPISVQSRFTRPSFSAKCNNRRSKSSF